MLFLSLCLLGIFGVGLLSHVLYNIPQVKKTIIKLLNI